MKRVRTIKIVAEVPGFCRNEAFVDELEVGDVLTIVNDPPARYLKLGEVTSALAMSLLEHKFAEVEGYQL